MPADGFPAADYAAIVLLTNINVFARESALGGRHPGIRQGPYPYSALVPS